MKVICINRGWLEDSFKARATKLITICKDHGLFPSFSAEHLNAVAKTFETGVPSARNNSAGHGGGCTPIETPDYLASYCLHLAAANIIFLTECDKNFKENEE